ncbi:hypothetical protein WJX84_000664 [Apatococcus fuscideae]|uniref:Uncharacterized protein n=1 Tax=Apatococcus fuscideae TaxID=2026836 RepID=A0AAW1ST71_9CHLO
MLLALESPQDEGFILPEGLINPVEPLAGPQGHSGRDALARLLGMPRAEPEPLPPHRGRTGSRTEARRSFVLIWAEAAEGELHMSPSLLLAYLLLASRRPNALFLRMATGFGFAQIGDYVSSLFFIFRRRGHRLKCWECGVKKKAPCGNTARPDLPWCCHRRLGEWLPQLSLQPSADGRSVCFQEEEAFFLTLLPPKSAIEAEQPVAAQLAFRPPEAAVVSLSELLKERPEHVVSTLQKALSRLAPNCRLFWGSDPWIMHRVNQIVQGHEGAANDLHRWLERTAYHKVPRAHQEEAVEQLERPFDLLVDDVMPLVRGAPNLGGATRNDLAARQAAMRARASGTRRRPLGTSQSQEMDGHAMPSASDTSQLQPAASGDMSGGSPPEDIWRQAGPQAMGNGCNGRFRVPAGRLRVEEIGRHAFQPFSSAPSSRGPLRLNVPSREAQQESAVYQEMGVEHEGGRGIPSLEQAEEMLARHPGAMMAAMAQVLLKGSPRSVSDTDTAAVFVDSGDDDSSQPRSNQQGCPRDVATPTVSDEPHSDRVRPRGQGERNEQVMAAPIVQMIPSQMQGSKGSRPLVAMSPMQGRRPLGASVRALRRSRLGTTNPSAATPSHDIMNIVGAQQPAPLHRPPSATAHWVDANQSAHAALDISHSADMDTQEAIGYPPRTAAQPAAIQARRVSQGEEWRPPVRHTRRVSPPAGQSEFSKDGLESPMADLGSPQSFGQYQEPAPTSISGWRAPGKRRRISHSLSLCTSAAEMSLDPILNSPRLMPTHQGHWDTPSSPAHMPEAPRRQSSGLAQTSTDMMDRNKAAAKNPPAAQSKATAEASRRDHRAQLAREAPSPFAEAADADACPADLPDQPDWEITRPVPRRARSSLTAAPASASG